MRTVFGNIGRLVVRPDARAPRVLEHAALAVDDGKIAWIGRSEELREPITEDAGGRLVTPGLIDAHTHLVFGGNRSDEFAKRAGGASYEEIAAAGGGIRNTVAKTRAAGEDELAEAALVRARWMLANGTTGFEAKTGYGLEIDAELKCLGALRRVVEQTGMRSSATLLPFHAVPPEFDSKADYVEYALEEMLPAVLQVAAEVEWLDAFVEHGYFDSGDVERLAASARRYDLGLRLHVDQLCDSKGAALAARVGAKTADHLEQTGADGIRAMAAAGTVPILLPASVFALGKAKYPDSRAMLDAGLPVVLATDFNPGSAPTPSLPFAMALACTHMRMSPDEALAATTVHAANSLEWEAGTLEVGARADFVVWDLGHEHELAYWIAAPVVREAFLSGQCRYSTVGRSA